MPGARERIEGDHAALIRAFVRGGRIVSFPAKWSKKLVLLDWAAQSFEPGTAYDEAAVNEVLRGLVADRDDGDADARADHVTLRRYLVDAGMLGRRDGFYWRAGGTVDVG
ncbi:MAG: DUF2087 domain-containing protein [Candidatus Nanopelagicales bacterium]